MDTGDGPKDNNGEFPIEGDLEKGSEENVTEDGGNNSMLLDWCKLFKELEDDAEQGGLHLEEDGNTSAVAQGWELEEGMVFLKKHEQWLRELFSDDPAAVAHGAELFQEQGSPAHGGELFEELGSLAHGGELFQELGSLAHGGELFQEQGSPAHGGALFQELGSLAHGGELFEELGSLAHGEELFQEQGSPAHGGELFQELGSLAHGEELFQDQGSPAHWGELFEELGSLAHGGELFAELGSLAHGEELFQEQGSPAHGGELFAELGFLAHGEELFQEQGSPAHWGELFEELGSLAHGGELFEELGSLAHGEELFQEQGSPAHGGMHMGQGHHQGEGGSISAMPAMPTLSEPVHEEMLNEQSNVAGILAPPASTFLGGSTSVVQIVRRERPAPNGVKIKVVTRRRQEDKPTQYGFHVDPDEDVASLRVLLADKTVDLPLNYHFYYDMAVMNESFSFRHYGIDGVRVPKIEVMDVTANSSQLVILKRKNSQDDAGPSIHKTEAAKKIRNA